MQEKLAGMKGVENTLNELLKTKKTYIKYKNKTAAKDVLRIENNLRICQYKRKEIKEALVSGEKAIAEINKLAAALKKIKSWYIPINSSGQVYSSYKGKMFAKNLLKKVKTINISLDNYIDELLDVSNHYQLNYTQFIERIGEFLENFYDGLISDWIFSKEIKISINLVVETITKIKRIQAMLKNDAADICKEEAHERTLLKHLLLETKLN